MSTGKGWLNVGRKRLGFFLLALCGALVCVGCASAPTVTDAIGKPLTDALITGAEINDTAGNISALVITLPDSPAKDALQEESKTLTERAARLSKELALVRAGYYSTLEDVGKLEADRDKWKDRAASRLLWAVVSTGLVVLVGAGLIVSRRFPF